MLISPPELSTQMVLPVYRERKVGIAASCYLERMVTARADRLQRKVSKAAHARKRRELAEVPAGRHQLVREFADQLRNAHQIPGPDLRQHVPEHPFQPQ